MARVITIPIGPIYPGGPCRGIVHVIEQGDSLYKLGKRYHVSVAQLMFANPYADVYNLQIGDELCIPVSIQPREMENMTGRQTGMERTVLPERQDRMRNDRIPERQEGMENDIIPERQDGMRNDRMPERQDGMRNDRMPERQDGMENGILPIPDYFETEED